MPNPQHIQKIGAHSNQETRPCESPSLRSTVAPDSPSFPRARKHSHQTLSSQCLDTQARSPDCSQPYPKRQKTSYYSSATSSASTSSSSWDRTERWYWDSLSQLRLTSNALRELDRRNALLSDLPDKDITVTREQHPVDITRFARRGGPDLSDIRNHPDLEEASSLLDSMPRNSKGKAKSVQKVPIVEKVEKRSSAYDRNFEQHLIDNNVFLANRKSRAANHAEWNDVLLQPRASLSRSSDGSYESFVRAVEDAKDEADIVSHAFPRIVGKSKHAYGQNVPFGHIEQITRKIVIPQPDWYQGEVAGEGNRTLRRRLDKAIIPSKRKDRPFLPTYFAEAKGPDGSLAVAQRQACHDGAVGARAMHSLQSLGGTESYDGNAYVASATFSGQGDLKLFTHHMTQPRGPGTLPHTQMTPLFSWSTTSSPQTFREARTGFRNVGDKANEHRVQFINDANRRNRIISPPPPTSASGLTRKPLSCQAPTSESSDSESGTSSDGDSNDDGDYKRSSRARRNGKVLEPNVVVVKPKSLAKQCPSPGPKFRRRRPIESSDTDSGSSPEEESSNVHRKKPLRKPRVVTISPKPSSKRRYQLRR